MKNGKNPTLKQKKYIGKSGLDHTEWLVVKDENETMQIISRETDKNKKNIVKWIKK